MNIRVIHALALRVRTEPACVAQFLISTVELDILWAQHESQDSVVLDCLVVLGATNEYSADGQAELRAVINECKAIADHYRPLVLPPTKTEGQLSLNQHGNIDVGDRFAIRSVPGPAKALTPLEKKAEKYCLWILFVKCPRTTRANRFVDEKNESGEVRAVENPCRPDTYTKWRLLTKGS